ncbi:hypothetical protein [Paenibacillus polymyxa]|uniref:hypothetical protein n=1 Tax=Paenibacillus polymyxa TaxID=1406 RepID=UPI000409C269|nr:hypothetical protein [Paenibacillus polymyxa]
MKLEKWIGEKDDTSGSYYEIGTKELKLRKGGRINAKKLYCFNSRFGESYYITDSEVINEIEVLLKNEDCETKLIDYLYGLVIREFGAIEFIVMIGHKIAEEREKGYQNGKFAKQKEIVEVLGLK